MPACPACTTEIPESAVFCPRCSAPTPWSSDVTHLAESASAPPKGGSRKTASVTSSGPTRSATTSWLTSTDAIDHGRFQPGTIFDERYRIIGRLGKGGMGEVYRADDLKLGQPVALKFLPEDLDRDPVRLTQLHGEVRMARQVSHPNVCRVYDVGEHDGHTFLSMEYVDGEDLASLLRRIGRFPEDRATELARQICAGLAAAHERGVVHRDLKPANIMLDGSGKIRVTDFGLAGAAGEALRAGTPAYMAPEQLAGAEVTPRSDIYALGLVLYEMYTGRRALEGRNVAELIAKREQQGVTPPSGLVRDLDASIDRAIMRCLELDPSRRPASALSVAAALPGGDPLAAALAAGETPSPEMVAAAGTTSALRPLAAFGGLAAALACLVISVVIADRLMITNIIPMPKPPLLLADRARQILTATGHDPGIDSAFAFMPANFLDYAREHKELGTRSQLASGQPSAVHFWFRGSPTLMIPSEQQDRVTTDNPPMVVSGMSQVVLDPEGRLIRMSVIPPQLDPPSPTSGSSGTGPNWKLLFDAAGLDLAAFTAAPPEWTALLYADARAAWTGPMPNVKDTKLRVEAGAYRGKPVYFLTLGPWANATRMPQTVVERRRLNWLNALVQVVILLMFGAAALIARHNLRKGRGDRRGAFQLAAFVSLAAIGVWILDGRHYADPSLEMTRFFVGQPLWAAGLLWLLYVAVEPYVRRFWPQTLVSWSRVMARQFRDPLVGRDILFGVALGALMTVLDLASTYYAIGRGDSFSARVPELAHLLGVSSVIARTLNQIFNSVLNAIFALFGMVLLKMILKKERLTVAVAIVLTLLLAARGVFDGGSVVVNMIAATLMIVIIVLAIQQLGLVATTVLFFVNMVTSSALVTLDPSKWFFAEAALLMAIPAAMAFYGFYVSRGGEPIFGARLLD